MIYVGCYAVPAVEQQCLPWLRHLRDGELWFSPNEIRRVVAELYEVFDIRSLEEAQQHFEESPY